MKNTFFMAIATLTSLLFIACGSDSQPSDQVTDESAKENVAAPSLSPSPSPTATPTPFSFIGAWQNMRDSSNFLYLNEDGSALSGIYSFTWKASLDDRISFYDGSVLVDNCLYSVIVIGGINSYQDLGLVLSCSISGTISYTKVR